MKPLIIAALTAVGLTLGSPAADKEAPKTKETKPAAADHKDDHADHRDDAKKDSPGKDTAKKDDHAGHDHAKKAGPGGGRLITSVEPHIEFLVSSEKKIEIRFVDDDNKVVAPGAQTVSVTLGDRTKPTKLVFTAAGDHLVSDKTIPEGNDYPVVVQIRAKKGAKPVNEKFNLNLTKCPTCDYLEYACTCDHDHEGHDHKDGDKHDHKDEAKAGKKEK